MHRPAPSAESARRPEARGGRARLFRLVPVLALLFGALCSLPAAAQTTISTDATLKALTGNTSSDNSDFSGTLDFGAFDPATESYTETVTNSITHVKLTPTVNEENATVKVGKRDTTLATVTSGSASGAIALEVGANAIDVEVTAQDGTTKKTYTVTVTRHLPGICSRTEAVREALLAKISGVSDCNDVTATHLSAITGTLDLRNSNKIRATGLAAGDFDGLTALEILDVRLNDLTSLPDLSQNTALKTLDVSNNDLTSLPDLSQNTALVTLGAFTNDLTSLPELSQNTALVYLYVSGNDLTSLPDLSQNTALANLWASHNELTSLPDLSQNTALVSFNVDTNPLSNLSALALTDSDGNALALNETFDGGTTSYTATAASGVTAVTVTPAAADQGVMPASLASEHPAPTIKAGPQGGMLSAVANGSASGPITLAEGENPVVIEVTGRAGGPKTYTVTVATPDASLRELTGNTSPDNSDFSGVLGFGTFDSATTSYTATVANSITHVKLTPTVNEENATVKVGLRGTTLATVASGSASGAIALEVGANAIDVEVTARDGTTKKTYTVTVTRPLPGICGRTEAVRDALLAKISGVSDCADVTATHLSAIAGILDLSNNSKIRATGLAAGDFDGLTALAGLWAFNNDLTSLPDLSKNTALVNLRASNNDLTSLPDLSQNTALVNLRASNNALTALPDLSQNTALETLDVSANALTLLPDLSQNTALASLLAFNNALTALPDLSQNTALQTLRVQTNALTALPDLSQNTALVSLNVDTNPLSNLSALELTASDGNALELNETFDGGTTSYTATAASGVAAVTVTPIAADKGVMPASLASEHPAPTIKVGPQGGMLSAVANGSASGPITLAEGENPVVIEVTGRAGGPKTYTVTVVTPDASLRELTGNTSPDNSDFSGELDFGTFDSAITSYTATVANSITHVKLTPTVTEENATVKVGLRGTTLATVASGSASGAVELNEGANAIDVEVTARDGTTTKTYTVTVTRHLPGICSRTEAVREALLAKISGVSDCNDVTATHLSAIAGTLYLSNNSKIRATGLAAGDFDGLTALETLNVSANALTSLPDLSQNTALASLWAFNNALTALPDLSKNTALKTLNVDENALTALPDLSQNTALASLRASNNDLTSLPDLSQNTALKTLNVSANALTALPDLSQNAALVSLNVDNNALTALPDLSKNTALVGLWAFNNDLTALPDLSQNTALASLWAFNNALTALPDLSQNTALETLSVHTNALTSLPDLSQNTALVSLNVGTNPLSNLSALALTDSDGNALALNETFDGGTTSYTATAASAVTAVTVTPTAADKGVMPAGLASEHPAPTIKVGPQGGMLSAVANGSASGAITLVEGENPVVIEVTGRAGGPKTYTVTVATPDASLRELTGNTSPDNSDFSGVLDFGDFDSATTSYTATVANSITHVKLTPTVNEENATVKVGLRGTTLATVASGSASGAIALEVGANAIDVEVTARDGTTTRTYAVTVTRQSSDATLNDLQASSSTSASGPFTALRLAPWPFQPEETLYGATVPNATTHVKVTPTVNESNASVGVRKGPTGSFTPVTSGAASGPIALDGKDAVNITVRVTAEDGTVKNYTLAIGRQGTGEDGIPPSADPLVSNLKQTADGRSSYLEAIQAQAFTTGGNSAGYNLRSIEFQLTTELANPTLNTSERESLRAELWTDSSGAPGARITGLTVPSSVSGGTVSFAAPPGTTLTTGTTYHAVLYTTGAAVRLAVETTGSAAEDTGKAAGWSIADVLRGAVGHDPESVPTWGRLTGSARIRVNGSAQGAAVPDAPTGLLVTPSNANLALSWTAPSGTLTGYDVHFTSSTSVADDAPVGSDRETEWEAVSRGVETDPPTASQTISDLKNTTRYKVRVRAKNAAGAGAWAFGAGTPKASTSGSTDATLRALLLTDLFGSRVSFSDPFSRTTYAYAAEVDAEDGPSVAVTPTVNEPNATVKVGMGTSLTKVTSGSESGNIDLKYGPNRITVEVTAQAGNTQNYTITVNRALPAVEWPAATSARGEGSGVLRFDQMRPPIANDMSGTLRYAPGATHPANLDDDLTVGPSTTFTMSAGDTYLSSIFMLIEDDAVNEEHETFTVTIEPGAGYKVGSPSTLTVTIEDNDPPAAPGGLSVEAGHGKLDVSWEKPDGPVAGYQARHKTTAAPDSAATGDGTDPSTGWVTTTRSGSDMAELTGLTNGTGYDVQVRVTDGQTQTGNGYGPWTATKSGTPKVLSDATLKALEASSSTSAGGPFTALRLAPYPFDPEETLYGATVPNATTHVKVTPTVNEKNASVGVRKGTTGSFTPVTSGSASGAIALDGEDAVNITVRVTAPDGTVKNYTLAIGRRDTGGDEIPPSADPLVSNLKQTASPANSRLDAIQAQAFTTGSNSAGYNLRSIEFQLATETGFPTLNTSERDSLRAELWTDSSGAPGARVTGLTVPSIVSQGTVSFAAPPGTTLTTGTTYYAVLYTTGAAAARIAVDTTGSDAEDTGKAAGWSIADVLHGAIGTDPESVTTWGRLPRSARIRVNGSAQGAAVPDAPTGLLVTPSNANLALSWTAPSGTLTGYDVHFTSSTSVADDAAVGSNRETEWEAVSRGHEADPPTASQTISDLTNTTRYKVRVRAKNAVGAGAWAFGAGTPKASNSGSTDATLRALVLTDRLGSRVSFTNPFSFSRTTYAYAAEVDAEDGPSVTVTPTVNESNATVKVGMGTSLTEVTTATASGNIDLKYGPNRITVEVTAQAGNTQNYTITVNRALPAVEWPAATSTRGEGSGTLWFSQMRPPVANDMSGTLTYAPGATHPANLDDDLTVGPSTTFTMSAGDTYLSSIFMPIEDDAVNEEHETFTVTIEPGAGYKVGSPSTLTVTIEDNDPPAAPGGPSVKAGNGKLDVSWNKPDGPVAGYQVRHKTTAAPDSAATGDGTDPSTGWVTTMPSGSDMAELTGLTNETDYDVQVRATDGQTQTGNGYGPWTAPKSGTPTAVDTTGPSVQTFDPADSTTTNDAGTNITLTFDEAIRKDNQNADFANADLAAILTLKVGSSSGDDIQYSATINSAKTNITINPSSNLADGDVYVAISDAYFDASGNQGTADEATFTVDTAPPTAPTFNPANGTTTNAAGTDITLTFGEAIKRGAGGEEFTTETQLKAILTLKEDDSAGGDITYAASIDNDKQVITINPSSDLDGGAVYVAVSAGYYDAVGNQGSAAEATFTVDTAPPTAPTFNPANGTTTNAAGTDITLTFGEAIKRGAGGEEFTTEAQLKAILTLKEDDSNGANITYAASIDSDKQVITINPSSDLDDGAVYVAVSAGYYDAAGNQGSAAEATFTVDTEAPTVNSVALTSSARSDNTYAIGDTISATATFSTAVDVDTGGGTPQLELDFEGTAKAASYASGTGTTALVFSYTVAENDEDANGISIGADKLALNGGTIQKTGSSTAAALTHDAVAASASHKVDGVRPTLSSATVSGTALTLTYSEALDTSSTPAKGDFTVKVAGSAVNLANATPVAVSGSAMTLTLATAVTAGQAVTASYTKGTNPIRDAAGNDAADLSDQAVSNTVAPTVSSVALSSNAGSDSTYAIGDMVSATATFSAAVDVDASGGTPQLELDVGGSARQAAYASGTGTTALVFSYTVAEGDADTDGIAIGADKLTLNGGTIQVKGGDTAATLTHAAVAESASHKVDGVLPTLSSAAVSGTALTLTYSEALDASSTPAGSDFTVKVAGSAVNLANATPVAVSGSAVTLTLATAVTAGQVVTASYTKGTNPIRDAAGNDAANLSDQAVTNTTAPTVSSVALSSNAGSDSTYAIGDMVSATATFSAAVDVDTTSGTPQLELDFEGTAKQADYSSGTGTTALVFSYAVAAGDADADGIGIGADKLTLNGGTIQVKGGDTAATLAHASVAESAGHKVDGVRPTLSSAAVSGTALTLTYSEALDTGSVPAASNFTVKVAGSPVNLANASPVAVSGRALTLTLASAVTAGQAVTASYAKGTSPIRDAAGNDAANLSDQAVTNTTAPTVSRVALTSSAGADSTYAIGDTVSATATFSTAVDVDTSSGTPQLELDFEGAAKTADYASGTGTTALVFSYTVAAGDADADGIAIGADKLTLNGGTIQVKGGDTAATLAHASVAESAGHKVDGVRPTLSSAAVSGTALTLTYSEALDTGSVPAAGDFTVKVAGSPVNLANASPVAVSGRALTLTLASAVTAGQAVTASYAKGTSPIRDAAGNDAANLSDQAVTNTTAPTVSRVALTSSAGTDSTYAIGDTVSATATFSTAVDVDTTSGTPQLELNFEGTAKTASYASGTGTAALVFSYTVAAGDADADGIAIGADKLTLNGGTIQVKGGDTAATLTHAAVLESASHKVDGVRPTLSSAAVSGTALTLTYSEALDTGSVPAGSDFAVKVAGSPADLATSNPVAVSGRAVTLTLASAVTAGQAVTASYTKGTNPIRDAAGNDAANLSDQAVTNTTAPTVSSVALSSNAGSDSTYAIGDMVSATATFSAAVDVDTTSGTPQLELDFEGTAKQADYSSGTGTTALVFSYAVAAGDADADGIGIGADKLTLNGGTIQVKGGDTAATLAHASVAESAGHKVDGVRPTLSSAAVSGTALTLTYSEALDTGSVPAASNFTVKVAGSPVNLANASPVAVSGRALTLTLASAVTAGQAVTASYAKGTSPIRDAAGNDAANLSDQAVTNTTAPTVSRVALTSSAGADSTYAIGDTVSATATFSTAVDVDTSSGTPQLELDFEGAAKTADYASGTGTTALVFSYTVAAGDADADGIAIGADKLTLNGGTIQVKGGDTAATLAHASVAESAGHKVDGVRPTLSSAAVSGTALTLTYSEALDTGSVPAAGDFTVKVAGSPVNLANASPVAVSGRALTLTLASAVTAGQAVTASYAKGTSPIRDAAGNDAANLSDQAVTNTTAPTVSRVALTSSAGTDSTYAIGDTVSATATFSTAVDVDTTSGTPQLELNFEGTAKTASYASGTGTAALVFSYTVAAGDADADGIAIGADKLTLNGGTIQVKGGDTAATLTHAAVLESASHKVDGVRPTLSSAAVSGTALTLTYSEALDTGSVPAGSDFAVKVAGSPADLATSSRGSRSLTRWR